MIRNFLPKQYIKDKKLKINHNYIGFQFQDYKKIIWLESLEDAELKLALQKAID